MRHIFILLYISLVLLNSCNNDDRFDDNFALNNNLEDSLKVKDSSLIASGNSDNLLIIQKPIITHSALINTSFGKITIGLYGQDAPKAVENFIVLARKGYYDGILVHRVAKNFLIQTGDRNTRYRSKKDEWGMGGESIFGSEFEDELDSLSPSYRIGYDRGVVAMANRGPNSNTSQFFICLDEAKDLVHKWTIFARVTKGMEVVEKIAAVDIVPGTYDPMDGQPINDIWIRSVKILKKIDKNGS